MRLHESNPLTSVPLREFVRHACTAGNVDRAGVFRHDPDARLLQGVIGVDPQGQLENITGLLYACPPDTRKALESVAVGARPYVLGRAGEPYPQEGEAPPAADYAMVPILHRDRIIGVLSVDNALTGRQIEESSLSLLTETAARFAPSLFHHRVTAASDLMLSCVLDQLDEGVCLLSSAGQVIYCSEPFCQMYGCSPNDLFGQHRDAIFFPCTAAGGPSPLFQEMHNSWSDWECTTYHRRSDGTVFPVRLRLIALRERCGIWCWVGLSLALPAEKAARRTRSRVARAVH